VANAVALAANGGEIVKQEARPHYVDVELVRFTAARRSVQQWL